jgi:putative intracellular protease/amidase
VPWQVFTDAGFDCQFATESGKPPVCDEKMLSGWTGTLLGASSSAKQTYKTMIETSMNYKQPHSWTDNNFSLDSYDLVFLPGGHEKSVRQIIDSLKLHSLLASYFPQTLKPSKKTVAAICHGVQVLAASSQEDGKSVIHDCKTTALIGTMEQFIFHATRLFLGDYYKTYGKGTDSVQQIVSNRLADKKQFVSSMSMSP